MELHFSLSPCAVMMYWTDTQTLFCSVSLRLKVLAVEIMESSNP